MEPFAVALFGAVAGAAVSKLVKVIEELNNETDSAEMRSDAILIKEELKHIEVAMKEFYDSRARVPLVISLQLRVSVAALRCLAYDIEDCIDNFNAKNMTSRGFAKEIRALKVRSVEMRKQRLHYAGPIAQIMGTAQWLGLLILSLFPILSKILKWAFGAPRLLYLDCLLYLSIFPPNHHVRTKPLIRRWLAEGLIEREKDGVNNLRDFTNNSSMMGFVQRSNNGNVKRCHPTAQTLEDIAQRSLSENFILVCDGKAQLPAVGARRLSVRPPANVQLNLPQDLSRLRTLAVFSAPGANLASYEAVLDFSRYKVLRVLDLEECAHLTEKGLKRILEDIVDMDNHPQLLMKYLSINLGSIDRIPRAIVELTQLETLDLSGADTVVMVYKEVLMLPNLKHLLGKFQLLTTDIFIDARIPTWLLKSRLRKFLSKNKSKLETLDGFVIGKGYGFPQLMSLMMRLRKVKVWCQSDASRRNLTDISKAITEFIHNGANEPDLNRSLSIDFQVCSREFVNNIGVPGVSKLDSLKLRGKLSEFPQFVAELSDIKELCLCSTGLRWTDILPGLLSMGGLQCLKLVEDDLESIQIQPADLRSIKRICIVSNATLDIAIQADALPQLVSLHILCQNLSVIPGTPGIEIAHMINLKEVAIHPNVEVGIKAKWLKAVGGHPYRPVPVLLLIQAP